MTAALGPAIRSEIAPDNGSEWSDLTLSPEEYRGAARRYRARVKSRAIGFLAPYMILWFVFLAIPTGWAIFLSFNTGGIVDDRRFVGLGNWSRMFSDSELNRAVVNTSIYVVIAVGVVFVLAMSLAALLNRYRAGGNFFKLALYFPLLAPPVLAAMIWFFLVHFDFGIFNLIQRTIFRGEGINFLGRNPNALLTIIGVEVWRGLGFWVLFFLAGMQAVPGELLDAARMDGARRFRRFRRITLPTLRPLLLFAIVIAVIFNFQLFDSVQALTQGGPALGTATVVWFIFRRMFAFQDTGLAFAASVGLLLVILLLTLIAFRYLGDRRNQEGVTAGVQPQASSDFDQDRAAYEKESRRYRLTRRIRAASAYTILTIFVLMAVGPVIYLISPAFRDSVSLFAYPPQWIPRNPSLENIRFLFTYTGYARWALNTVILALGATILTLITNTLAGYAFARLSFPGKKVIFFTVLATLMVPVAAVLAPTYLLVREIGTWPIIGKPIIGLDTYGGLILPLSVSPLGVFMMRQFIQTLPAGLYEAAKLDGASDWRILRKIVLPLIKPALVVLAIFVFMMQWAQFLWPLVATSGDKYRVLTVGIASLNGQFVTNWGVMAAAALLTLIPVTIVFLFFQKWFVQASMAGALKQ